MLLALFGLMGSKPASPIRKQTTVKATTTTTTTTPTAPIVEPVPGKPISNAVELAPVATAGDEQKALEDAGVDVPRKRTTRSAKPE